MQIEFLDEEAFEIMTKFANLGELVKEKEYEVEGGKRDVHVRKSQNLVIFLWWMSKKRTRKF